VYCEETALKNPKTNRRDYLEGLRMLAQKLEAPEMLSQDKLAILLVALTKGDKSRHYKYISGAKPVQLYLDRAFDYIEMVDKKGVKKLRHIVLDTQEFQVSEFLPGIQSLQTELGIKDSHVCQLFGVTQPAMRNWMKGILEPPQHILSVLKILQILPAKTVRQYTARQGIPMRPAAYLDYYKSQNGK